MFGFGKEKLNDRLFSGILGEIGMFQSWHLDNKRADLSFEQINMILKRIIEREKVDATKEQFSMLELLTIGNDVDAWTELREKTGFDKQVAGFCRSINLPETYYK